MPPMLKKRYQIVIVEDDPDGAALITGLVQEQGGHVSGIVSSMMEAKRVIQGASIDVVLVNTALVGPLDGASPEQLFWTGRDPPLVLIGSELDVAFWERGFQKAFFGYVAQPVQAVPLGIGVELAVSLHRRISRASEDITAGNQAGDDPYHHIQLLETLLNTIPNPVFHKNTEGVYIGCNESFARTILGLSKDTIIGHTIYDFPDQIPKAFADKYHEQDQALFHRPGTQEYEGLVACADGVVRDFVFNKAVFFGQNGKPAGMIGVMMDVTERKRIEKELLAAKKRAEMASQAKSDFLASMSHEIRTPLNSILGMIDLTLQEKLLAEQKDNLSAARDSARHLLHVINDILDLSKIEAGKIELEEINFDLHALVLKIVKSFAYQAQKRKIDCHHHIEPDVPQIVKGDAFRLRQVLVNLISNAIKFTTQGEINIELKGAGDDPLQKWPADRDGQPVSVLFCVRDTGPGIHRESLNKIFENFSQGEYSTTRKYGGTGLGLSISKYLVEMMQGRIWVESRVGEGSAFFFTAMFKPGDAEGLKKEKMEPVTILAFEPQSIMILLAEDNPINARVATKFLERLGYGIDRAGNGREVLEMLSNKHYDLVLMDVEMPVMDGLEAARRIRAGEAGNARRNTPIIAMTAHALSEFKRKCEKVGMNDYLAKPVDFYELGSVIEKNIITADYYLREVPASPIFADEKALLDKAGVLRRIGGDYGLLDYLYESFNEELPGKIACLKDAVADENYEKLYQEAHTLKNNCGAVGALTCQRLAEELEQAAKEMRSDQLEFLASKLINELGILQNTFDRKEG